MRSRFSLWLVINIFLFAVPNRAQDQWLEVRSPYFRVLTDGGERRARETALAFEQLRSVFSQVLPQNTVDDSLPLLIVALRNAKELSEFAPLYKAKPVQSAGLCQTGPDGNAILFNLVAESWLVVHYLWNNHLQEQLLNYLDLIRHKVGTAQAIQQAFKMTPTAFDRAIEKYLREGPRESRLPLASASEKVQLVVKPIPPLEAAAILADIHLHEHDYEERGISEFQKILKEDPENVAAHRGLGYAYFNRHDFDAAMLHLDQAAAKNPNDWQVHYYQALLFSQKQDTEVAGKMEKAALRVTELNPEFAAGYGLLGFALMSQHKSVEATAAYEKALELDPGNEANTLNLAELYSLQNRLAEAKPLFFRLQNSPNETIARAARSHLEFMK